MISRRSYALASIAVLMIVWGSTFVVTKAAVREIPPLTLAVLRYLVAAVVLLPVAAEPSRGRTLWGSADLRQ